MLNENDIVVSGIAGRFPQCDSTDELQKALLEGLDLVSDSHDRWPNNFHGLPSRAGLMKNIETFDSMFFRLSPRQADGADPRTRILSEVIFEAFVDSGYNPIELRGSNTGVYIGMIAANADDSLIDNRVNYTRLGRSSAVCAGTVSFAYDLKGPSYALDTACSSSLFAFCQAVEAIRHGECDAALVCGSSIVLDPLDSLEYKMLNILSPTGKCNTFDVNRDGFVKSEAVAVVLLQKRKDARRVYATIAGNGTNNDGFKLEGLTRPDSKMQTELLKEVYQRFDLNPNDVSYIEAHGTGTQVGDMQEARSITDFLCKDRKTPLLISSVKTSIGHSEMASGVVSVIKTILSMETGIIPKILHLKEVDEELAGIKDGKLKIVTENTPWNEGLMAVNSFGIGGTNAHVVMAPNNKVKMPYSHFPNHRLIKFSGRTEKGLQNFMDLIKNNPTNIELFSFLDQLFRIPIQKYHHRGYCLLSDKMEFQTQKGTPEDRDVWFIYSGVGSQWPKMGKDLMQLDIFKNSMEECASYLRPYGVDLIDVVTNGNVEIFKNFINLITGNVAMAICFTDLMEVLNIKPKGFIGHSFGEISCAYADKCLTKEEAMLVAYARGYALMNTKFDSGTLAVVALKEDDLRRILPSNVYIACFNCEDNFTISGPKQAVKEFVEILKSKDIFAELVHGAEAPYHSKYIEAPGQTFLQLLRKIIKTPKLKSSKWISSSVLEEDRQNDLACNNSAEYHYNNFISPVYFESAIKHIPQGSLIIELSAKGLLNRILKKNLGADSQIITISSDQAENNLYYLLSALGKIHLAGGNPDLTKLYDGKDLLPLSRGSPSIGSIIDWDHSVKHEVQYYTASKHYGESIVVDLKNPNMQYLENHKVQGRLVIPVIGYLVLAWEAFARILKKSIWEVPVMIESVKIRRMTLLSKENCTTFTVNLILGTGSFEISESGSPVAHGVLKIPDDIKSEFSMELNEAKPKDSKDQNEYIMLTNEDAYDLLNRMGLNYSGEFKAVQSCNPDGTIGSIKWMGQWTAFMDALLHFSAMLGNPKLLHLPLSLERLIIDPKLHSKLIKENEDIPVYVDFDQSAIRAGGVEVKGFEVVQVPKRKNLNQPRLEEYKFVPYDCSKLEMSLYDIVALSVQIVAENMGDIKKLKVLSLCQEEKRDDVEVENAKNEAKHNTVVEHNINKGTNTNELIPSAEELKNKLKQSKNQKKNQNDNGKMNGFYVGNDKISNNEIKNIPYGANENDEVNGFELVNDQSATVDKGSEKLGEEENHKQSEIEQNIRLLMSKEFQISIDFTEYNVEKGQKLVKGSPNLIIIDIDKALEDLAKLEPVLYRFFLVRNRTNAKHLLATNNYALISIFKTSTTNYFLIGAKQKLSQTTPKLIRITTNSFDWFDELKNTFGQNQENPEPIYILNQGEQFCGMVGLFNCLKIEAGGKFLKAIHIADKNAKTFSFDSDFYKEQLEKNVAVNVLKNGQWGSYRFFDFDEVKEKCVNDAKLTIFNVGDYGSLKMVETSPYERFEASVYYAGLNFKDTLIANGALNTTSIHADQLVLGHEFSGRNPDGTRIFGLGVSTIASSAASHQFVWKVPDNWTLEEAASVPVIYGTLMYAFFVSTQLQEDESVFIQAGAGGVGLAAIHIALKQKCKVITMVSTEEKRNYLKEQFPQLKDQNILNSKDKSFERKIMKLTNGRGVDVVLNSLAGDYMEASMRCLAIGGRFIDIGKVELAQNSTIKSSMFTRNTSMHAVSLDHIAIYSSKEVMVQLHILMEQGISSGLVVPIPKREVYEVTQATEAFKRLNDRGRIGKVLMKIRDEEPDRNSLPGTVSINAIPSPYFNPLKSFVIVGGLGGLGLELARWLVDHGAKKLVLNSRSGLTTGYQSSIIKFMRSCKAEVIVSKSDPSDIKKARKLIQEAMKLGPVGGIFNLALVLKDALLENQTKENFEEVYNPKVKVTVNLDKISKELCPSLEHFVAFSSVSCGKGNLGQSNYGFANSTVERIIENRIEQGLPGFVIQWGPIADVGSFARSNIRTGGGGISAQPIDSCLEVLNKFFIKPTGILSSTLSMDVTKGIAEGASLYDSVLSLFGIKDPTTVNDSTTLLELGMDSLMGFEVKQYLYREHEIDISVKELRELTLAKIKDIDKKRNKKETE